MSVTTMIVVFCDAKSYSGGSVPTFQRSQGRVSPALLMEAAGFSGASVHFNLTIRCYIPKDSNFQSSFTVGTDISRFHVTINSRGRRNVSLSE